MAKTQNQEHTFESAYTELEGIVAELESGEISLEQSIEKFERGVLLYQYCRGELDKIEEKVKILTDKLRPPESAAMGEFLDQPGNEK